MSNPAFDVLMPHVRSSCVVFASPHSSRTYPRTFVARSVLDEHSIRTSEDAFVDQLFAPAAEFGAPLLTARVPRAYVDLNRSADELDPALVLGARKQGHNPRVASGLGVIPRVVANGRAIYSGKISMEEARMRIDRYWRPYHLALQGLLSEAHQRFGQAILVDCHSMPHEAMDGITRKGMRRPEIVLGDRFGAAASSDVVDRIEEAFTSAGFLVARNAPFAGAYVTQAYGRPSRNQHAVQIEIDRALYMDERRIRPNARYGAFKTLMRRVIADIAAVGFEGDQMPLAAE
ncbi:N-formylglutamate amidohydrolase [Marinibacterium profundimaris]|uniref:N-formylglutamate amidohydrolase n=1 Tax=Marinibacterium profundimaris TaxID=1679460 RepID=A0A225NNX3_9RHOB|nr:N-formylglutamate amidohydrolase [Marinibacterium profundimaris]OWU76115.1 N-formylglutamate amidohydrolase [Marinibacterium profundimaris]